MAAPIFGQILRQMVSKGGIPIGGGGGSGGSGGSPAPQQSPIPQGAPAEVEAYKDKLDQLNGVLTGVTGA